MPCYEVRTVSVEFQAEHFPTLEKAAIGLGWGYVLRGETVTLSRGSDRITIKGEKAVFSDGLQGAVNELKRGYTLETLKRVAPQFGWLTKLQQTTPQTNKLAGKFVKRYN